jgi:hypothetical protein
LQPTSKLQIRLGKIEASKAVIQFAVYPDSFDAFRSLRAKIWNKKFSVNWSPMSHGEVLTIGGGSGGIGVQ